MPTVRNTLSLRPQGFYGYAFLLARIAEIIILAIMTGLVSHLVTTITNAGQSAPASLIATILFTSAALLWCLLSWTGYSRRYLPYRATCAVDLVLLLPFAAVAAALARPLAPGSSGRCADVPGDGKFELVVLPAPGKIVFPAGGGRGACFELAAAWGLLVAVCALLAVSAVAVGFLELGERQVRKAIFAVREENAVGGGGGAAGMGGYGPGYGQGVGVGAESRGYGPGFASALAPAPEPMAQPGATWTALRNDMPAGLNDSFGSARGSSSENRLRLNRPVTIGRVGGGGGGGLGDDEPLPGPPSAARVYQGPRSYRAGAVPVDEVVGSPRPTRPRPGAGFGLPSNPLLV